MREMNDTRVEKHRETTQNEEIREKKSGGTRVERETDEETQWISNDTSTHYQ